MPIDYDTALTPGWWLKRLIVKLAVQQEGLDELDGYYRGTNGIPVSADKAVKDSYRRLMRLARTNFAELVVEAVRERMHPTGFRTGADGDELGDKEAWRIWQANSLDADNAEVSRSALSKRRGFVIVGPTDPDIGAPLITPEDPREVCVEYVPGRRRKVAAGLKVFTDTTTGTDLAYLYLPGQVWRAARPSKEAQGLDEHGWEWDNAISLPVELKDVVPVVEFANRDQQAPTAEFEPHLSVLDRINYSILNRLEIATLQAFRQRGIKGVPNVDATGDLIDYDDIFAADPGALWVLPATAEIWESGQVDLGPLRAAIRDDVQDLAATSRTPLFYLTPDAANGSAEGASLAREGLVFKTQDRIVQASESWEQVMSLAFRFTGDEQRASRRDMEVLWAPPERHSLAERADAASKAMAGGVPWRTVMRTIWQFSPQEVDRMEAERQMDALMNPAPFGEPADAGF